MQSHDDHVSEATASDLRRRGDVQKCPICGSQVDAEAYHCAQCRNYFCYHCRARLLTNDPQFQCGNQHCDYYAKLICGICDPLAEKDEPPAVYAEPEDGYWPAWLLVVVVAAALVGYFTSFLWAAGIAIVAFTLGGYGLQRAGMNIFGRERKVEHQRKSSFHSCINCQQPVKELDAAG